jgi:hypothetical protein
VLSLVALGVSGRIAAIGGLLLLGAQQALGGLSSLQILLIIGYTGVLFAGTGPFSLWAPEEWLIRHRAGERRSQLDPKGSTMSGRSRAVTLLLWLLVPAVLVAGAAQYCLGGGLARPDPPGTLAGERAGPAQPGCSCSCLPGAGGSSSACRATPSPTGPCMGYRLAAFAVSYFTPGAQFGGEPCKCTCCTSGMA